MLTTRDLSLKNLSLFFPYYGSKYRLASKYSFPQYKTIIEPFCGAAGYSIRYFYKNVILNDIDPVIYGIWNYLIHESEESLLSLPNTIIKDVRDYKIPQEAKWLIGFWINRASSQPANKVSSFAKNRHLSWKPEFNSWTETVKNRITSQLKYIRHWEIHNKEYYDLDNVEATWFVDPPYQKSGKHYKYRRVIYDATSYWCRSRRGQCIVCEEMGANWLDFKFLYSSKSTASRSQEMVWENLNVR